MTRKEVINILNTIDGKDGVAQSPSFVPNGHIAIKMAIEALKQEPCGDCISREAAQNLFSTDLGKTDRKVSYQTMCVDAVFALEALPSVTPARPKGKWININNRNGKTIALRCSICGKSPRCAIRSDFCPNCGADMREEENEYDNRTGEKIKGICG